MNQYEAKCLCGLTLVLPDLQDRDIDLKLALSKLEASGKAAGEVADALEASIGDGPPDSAKLDAINRLNQLAAWARKWSSEGTGDE